MRTEPADASIVENAPESGVIERARLHSAPHPPRPHTASPKAGVDERARKSAEAGDKIGWQDELVYADRIGPGFQRRKTAKGFAYFDPDDLRIRSREVLKRIDALAIPPAYVDVWICPTPNGHIQATGRDARGRLQYRYHQRWSEIANLAKFDRLIEFARILPRLREKVEADLGLPSLPRQKVLASIVRLLETTLIRVGNDEYARANKSYGLTTLRNRHLRIEGWTLRFEFKGKSGRSWKLALTDRRVARVLRGCQDLPGQRLFQYVDEEERLQSITSSDVNAYLRELSGRDITAKDFRTWSGTWRAAIALAELPPARSATEAKANLRAIVAEVARQLGNTPAICRKSYIHPKVVAAPVISS